MAQMPNDEIMSEMSRIALEQATTMLAAQARAFAKTLDGRVTGPDALLAFANAIESNNAKVWPRGDEQ